MEIIKIKKSGIVKFETVDEKIIDLKMDDYKIVDDYHSSFLIDDYLNTSVEI